MTRRERHVRMLGMFDVRSLEVAEGYVLARLGWAAFTDEAIEMMARKAATDWRRLQRMNAQNRAILARQQERAA